MLSDASVSHNSYQPRLGPISPPMAPDQSITFKNELLVGFIKHPDRFPLQVRRLYFWERTRIKVSETSNIGLTFSSNEYQKPGSIIEITIPMRIETHRFLGKTVMVKETHNDYEIGIRLLNAEDSQKLRIVEQICHIELYLNDKRYKEGPFLSREKLTEEWISLYASSFPKN